MKRSKKSWHQNFKRASKELRTDGAGITHDSTKEMQRWKVLQLNLLTGEIRNLKRQVKHQLVLPNGVPILTPSGKVAVYTSDFEYERRHAGTIDGEAVTYIWEAVIEDVKGYASREAMFRIAVFEAISGQEVKIIK